jgi:transposase-like protein
MPQTQLPIFPASSCAITPELAFEARAGQVVYFNGHLPVFAHPTADLASFRFFSSQLIATGVASQVQIARAFGVPLVTVKRACKKLREEGAAGFFRPPVPRQGHRLTAVVLAAAQALLDAGIAPAVVAARLGVLPNTLNKAIHAGRLKKKTAAAG